MAKINSFEDIEVWQQAMSFCTKIYELTNNPMFHKDFPLRDQIRKSAVSVPSNIAEGFERESNNSFIYFLLIAKASNGELRTQLIISKNLRYISETEFKAAYEECLQISKQLSGFISYLRSNRAAKKSSKSSKPS